MKMRYILSGHGVRAATDACPVVRFDSNRANPYRMNVRTGRDGPYDPAFPHIGAPPPVSGMEILIPMSPPFKACMPQLQLNSIPLNEYGVVKLDPMRLGPSDAFMYARLIVRGFGNVTPNQADPPPSTVIEMANSRLIGPGETGVLYGSNQPFMTHTTVGKYGYLEVGKTYRVFGRVWTNSPEEIWVTWPRMEIIQQPLVKQLQSVSPCIQSTNDPYFPRAPADAVMRSPNGEYEGVMDVDGSFTVTHLPTKRSRKLITRTTPGGGQLCLTPTGTVVGITHANAAKPMYFQYGDGVSETLGPFRALLTDDGALLFKDNRNATYMNIKAV